MPPVLSGREWVFLATALLAPIPSKLPVMCPVPLSPSLGNKELLLPLRFHPGQMRSGFQSLLKQHTLEEIPKGKNKQQSFVLTSLPAPAELQLVPELMSTLWRQLKMIGH